MAFLARWWHWKEDDVLMLPESRLRLYLEAANEQVRQENGK